MRRLLLCCLVLGAAVDARADEAIEKLWAEEGQTLRRLVEVSRERDLGEALLRLGLWERDAARRLEERGDADPVALEKHRDAADEALSAALDELAPDRMPEALFSLGDLRRSRGRYEDAEAPLARLVEEFPDAPLALDAAVALGDDTFEAARLADAVQRYEFVIARAPEGESATWARYKLAWCRINLGEHAEARRLLSEVASRGEGSLVTEARRDFVIALARDASVDPDQALKEIAALVDAPALRGRYGEGWANLVAAAGRDEEAAATYARLLPNAPMEAAARMLAASMDIAVRRRARADVLAMAPTLADLFEARDDFDDEVRSSAERALRVAAVTFHGEGRAAGDDERLDEAYSLYAAYLRGFADDPHAYELHHHAGELLLSLHRSALAERHYTAAVLIDLKRLEEKAAAGKWLASSARGAVVAARKLVEALEKKPPATDRLDVREASTATTRVQPEPLRPEEKVLVAACDRYLQALPDGEHAVDVAFQRAIVFYRRHWFEEAVDRLKPLALSHPAHEAATPAARAALDALRQLDAWDDLAQLAREFATKTALSTSLGTELSDVRQAAMLAAAEAQAKAGHHEDAARRYLQVADEFPSGPKLRSALYNAASSLSVLGRLDEAVKVRARLLEEGERNALSKRATERQIEDLLRLGRFDQAKAATLSLVEKASKDAATRLHDAVVLAEAAGDVSEARRLRERYLREHPRGADAFAHALALAQGTRGCIPSMKAFRRVVRVAKNAPDRVVALVHTAKAEARCNELWWARKHAAEALAQRRRVPADSLEALDALADAALITAGAELDRYGRLRVRMPFQKTIPAKLEALQSAENALAKVVAMGRPEAAICALSASGRAWAEFAWTLSSVRAPAAFTEEQKMLFEEELASKAQPLSDRALATLKQARAKAREAGLAPTCLNDALESLAKLAPGEFAPRLEMLPKISPDTPAAKGDLDALLLAAPDAPAAWLIAARLELARERPQAALLLLDRIDADDPLAGQAAQVRFEVLRQLGRPDAARAIVVRQAREHHAEWALRHLASDALARRDWVAARDALGRLPTWREETALQVSLAVAARALGDAAYAKPALLASIEQEETKEARLALGVLLCAEGNAPAEGLASIERFEALGGSTRDIEGLEAVLAACRALAKGAP